jgi:hypothetical protein
MFKILALTGLAMGLSFGAAQAAVVEFTEDDLVAATTVTVDGLTLDVTTTGGEVTNYIDPSFATTRARGSGIYIGPGAATGNYQLNFSTAITSLSFTFDWLTDRPDVDSTETVTHFQADGSAVAIGYTDLGGTSFDGSTISTSIRTGQGTISYAGGPFNVFSFDHDQGPATIGFVIRNVQVATVPVPAAFPLLFAGVAALGMMGRRRRKAA